MKHISEFVERNNILNPNQHGYRSGLSIVTQLVETMHDLAQCINDHSQIGVIFMDYSKAFDRVSHVKLLVKLKEILSDGPILQWIHNYLPDRHQFIQFGDHASNIVPVTSGVPQGSVLAPLLFLLYINDLTNVVDVKVRLFADCMFYQEVKTVDDQIKLNNALNRTAQWCRDWSMMINPDKTVSM